MRMKTKTGGADIKLILLIGILLFLFWRFMTPAMIISCGETTYSSFSWQNNRLIYSGIFGGSTRCGGESGSPLGGTTLTGSHNYAGGWYGSPLMQWNAESAPAEIFAAYPAPEEAASNMQCRVHGSTQWFGNYWGDRFNVNIPYDIEGKRVEWAGAERGFRCVIDIPQSIQDEFIRQADANGCWGHICNMIYSSTPVIQGNAEFTVNLPNGQDQEQPNQEPSEQQAGQMSLWEQFIYLIKKIFWWVILPP